MEAQCEPRLLKGIEEFNQGLYFQCHETLEEVWLEEHGEDRLFYQGIIQIAVGYLKWEEGVMIGAIKLWRSGLEKLAGYPAVHLGVRLDSFIDHVKGNLREMEIARQKGGIVPPLRVPQLSLSA
jgi:predicted metal-dependent hydrolase